MAKPLKTFDLVVGRSLPTEGLGWPSRGEAGREESFLAGNRHYVDLRGARWGQVKAALELEAELIRRCEAGEADEAELNEELEAEWEVNLEHPLFGLDIGVAAPVLALSAAGAVPAYSCNGGALWGEHAAQHPVVAFYLRPGAAGLILACAEAAGAGLEVQPADGLVLLYGADLLQLQRFAAAAYERRTAFSRGR